MALRNGTIDRRSTVFVDTSALVALLVPADSLHTSAVSQYLACVGVGKYPNKKFGFIDPAGKFVINPTLESCGGYASLGGFSDGIARVTIIENGEKRAAYIDKGGNVVLRPQFGSHTSSWQFVDGLAAVTDNDSGKLGYIDITGKFVWPLTK